jgi:hypothetical protein
MKMIYEIKTAEAMIADGWRPELDQGLWYLIKEHNRVRLYINAAIKMGL